MIRTTLAIAYFSYLLMGGLSMSQGIAHADKTSTQTAYLANLCQMDADAAACARLSPSAK